MKEFFKNLGGALIFVVVLFFMFIPSVYFAGVCIHLYKSQKDEYFKEEFSEVFEFYFVVFTNWHSWVLGVFGALILSNLPEDMFAYIYLVFIIFLFITAIPRYFIKKRKEKNENRKKINRERRRKKKEKSGGVK